MSENVTIYFSEVDQTNLKSLILWTSTPQQSFNPDPQYPNGLDKTATSFTLTRESGDKIHYEVKAYYTTDAGNSITVVAGDVVVDSFPIVTNLMARIDKFPLTFTFSGIVADPTGTGGVYCVDVTNLDGVYPDEIGDGPITLPSVTISGLVIGSVAPILTPSVNWNTGEFSLVVSGVVDSNTLNFFTGSGTFANPIVNNTITLDGTNGWGGGTITLTLPSN